MKFLGWLKGKGYIMAGMIGAILITSAGCSSAGKDPVDVSTVDNPGGEEDVTPAAEVFPVYGVWEEVREPADVYGIWDAAEETRAPNDAAVYGIWDVAEEANEEPEVMDMYGIWEDTGSAAGDTKKEVEPNPEVYGIWPADTTD